MARQNRAPPIRWAPMTLHGCGKNWGLATSGGNGHHTVLEMFSLSVVWRTFHAMPSPSEKTLCLHAQRDAGQCASAGRRRSEEQTSELQSLMRISYAVFGLIKKT